MIVQLLQRFQAADAGGAGAGWSQELGHSLRVRARARASSAGMHDPCRRSHPAPLLRGLLQAAAFGGAVAALVAILTVLQLLDRVTRLVARIGRRATE